MINDADSRTDRIIFQSLLPGFRDLRTPLAAGFLLAAAAWLTWGESVPPRGTAAGVPESIYILFETLGSYTLLAVLTFGSYTAGMIWMAPVQWLFDKIGTLPKLGLRTYADQTTTNLLNQTRPVMEDEGGKDAYAALTELLKQVSSAPLDRGDPTPEKTVRRRISNSLAENFKDAAVVLQAENHELWDIYDRGTAEAQFRFGIAIPFGITIGLLATNIFNTTWQLALLFGVVAAGVMLALSVIKLREAVTALRRGLEAANVKSRKQVALEEVIGRLNR